MDKPIHWKRVLAYPLLAYVIMGLMFWGFILK